jgi:monoamine oxidase
MKNVIIIGGGLSGLTAAYYLKKKGVTVQVLEANDYLGGRIKTIETSSESALEIGATWVFNDPNLKDLLSELDIELYEQYVSETSFYEMSFMEKAQEFDVKEISNSQKYYKITGGPHQIIKALEKEIGKENILLNSVVKEINETGNFINITTENGGLHKAKRVLITLPPKLLEAHIKFVPKLPKEGSEIRKNTFSWMGDPVKSSEAYKAPFWRNKKHSELAISNIGMLKEVQGDVNGYNTAFDLVDFSELSLEECSLTKEERRKNMMKDLIRIFGNEVKDIITYQDYIWNMQPFTSFEYSINQELEAHQNNGNKAITIAQMNNKLFFAGAETSTTNPGYMEGAVESAIRAFKEILSVL